MTGVPIARIGGIEVRVQLGWVIVVALVAALAVIQVSTAVPSLAVPVQWVLGALVGVAFFVSAMLHDLAHAVIARRRGVEVRSILISFFGGTNPSDPTSEVAGDDLAIAVSGPIVSTLIGLALGAAAVGIGGVATEFGRAVGEIVAVLAVLNLLIGLVNLVPAYPMDGGRIVRAIAWRRTNSVARGWSAAASTGRFAGLAVIVIGAAVFVTGEIANGGMVALSGWFLVLSSRAISERLKVDALIGGLSVGDVMERDPATVHPTLTVDTLAGQLLDGESPTTAIPVVDGDAVVGVLGVRDIRKLRRAAWTTSHVGDVMTKPPRLEMLGPSDTLVAGVERIQRAGLDGIPVVEDGRLLGILTRRAIGDAVRARTATLPGRGRPNRF